MNAEMQPAGEPNAAIFAADGRARHRAVRGAVAAGVVLLAAWLIALALGVLGGFGSLPSLPSQHSRGSHQESSPAPHARRAPSMTHQRAAAPAPSVKPTSPAGGRVVTPSPSRRPAPSPATAAAPPRSAASTIPSSNGRRLGTTKTAGGKPLDSPGNGPGGSGAPGQFR